MLNFAIDHVTINNSKRTGLDLNGVNGATIDHVNVNNTSNGNGITLTNSANVTITNSTTTGNAWGGLALYQSNVYYDQQVNNITVDGTNTFNEANGIYAQDQSAATDFGTIDLSGQGINYVAKLVTPAASGDGTYTYFQKTEQGAFDLGDAFNTRYGVTGATVQGYAGDSVNGNLDTSSLSASRPTPIRSAFRPRLTARMRAERSMSSTASMPRTLPTASS